VTVAPLKLSTGVRRRRLLGHAVNHPTVQEVPIAIFRLDGAPV
jgi:hypothetical protein